MIKQVILLLKIELYSWKKTWFWFLVMISIFPIIALSFINFILPPTDINQILKITTGAMVFPIILMGMNTYAINISAGIDRGDYNYYKIVSGDVVCILIVKLLSGLVMTLPSVFITANFGSMINNINLTYNLESFLVLLLSVITCVSFGIMLGVSRLSYEVTNVVSQLIMMFISFLSPVMISHDRLPIILDTISYIFPTTYISNLFFQAFGGASIQYYDMLALFLFFILFNIIAVHELSHQIKD
jgi:ABC-2 type transporter